MLNQNNYIALSNPISISSSSFAISIWLNVTVDPAGAGWVYNTNTSTNKMPLNIFVTGDGRMITWLNDITAGEFAVLSGSLNHFVLSYDGTKASTYLNGNLKNSSFAAPLYSPPYNHSFFLGDYSQSSKMIFDEFRFFNRTLSQNEISSLFNER